MARKPKSAILMGEDAAQFLAGLRMVKGPPCRQCGVSLTEDDCKRRPTYPWVCQYCVPAGSHLAVRVKRGRIHWANHEGYPRCGRDRGTEYTMHDLDQVTCMRCIDLGPQPHGEPLPQKRHRVGTRVSTPEGEGTVLGYCHGSTELLHVSVDARRAADPWYTATVCLHDRVTPVEVTP